MLRKLARLLVRRAPRTGVQPGLDTVVMTMGADGKVYVTAPGYGRVTSL